MTTILKATHRAYDALVASTVDQIITLGIQKGGEYAGDKNRLENFVRNAIALRLEPEQVWAVYAGKHWDAIVQYVNDLAEGRERPRMEPITGRVDDMIVYLLLMKCMMIARTCVDYTYDITVTEKGDTNNPEVPSVSVPLSEIPSFLRKKDRPLEDQLADAVAQATTSNE